MCNRCNEEFANTGCRRCGENLENEYFDNNRCSGNFNYDDAAWEEAQRIINRIDRRRCRENRCARQFVRCIRNINNGCNW